MIDDETFAEPPDVMLFHGGEADIIRAHNAINNEEGIIMTFEEYKARKRWDTDMMTEEEKEAHRKHVASMYGAITDDTFVCPEDALPVLAGV